uniref:Uncharacterized protein n=1 Tax=Pseudomonas phage HRDY3 TaxID=3236930 RepID=A0AB39CE37_9VIRU
MQTFKERGVSVVAFIEHWTFIGERYGWRYAGTQPKDLSHTTDPLIEARRLCRLWQDNENRYKIRDRDPFGIETSEQLGFLSVDQLASIIRRANTC